MPRLQVDLDPVGQELLHELLPLGHLGAELQAPLLQSDHPSIDQLALGHAEERTVPGHVRSGGNRRGPQVRLRPTHSGREPLCQHIHHCPAYAGRIDYQADRASLTERPGGLELPEPRDDAIGYPLVGRPQWWPREVAQMQLMVVGWDPYLLAREQSRLAHHLALAYGHRHALEHGECGVVRGLAEVGPDPVPHYHASCAKTS